MRGKMQIFSKLKKKMDIRRKEKLYGTQVAEGIFASGSILTILGGSQVPNLVNNFKYDTIILKNSVNGVIFTKLPNLRAIYLGENVNSLDLTQIFNCKKLECFIVDRENKEYSSEQGVLFSKDKKTLYRYPMAKTSEIYSIPEGVERLNSGSFMFNTHLKTVKIPKSLCKMPSGVFYGCKNLETVLYEEGAREFNPLKFDGTAYIENYCDKTRTTHQASHKTDETKSENVTLKNDATVERNPFSCYRDVMDRTK